MLNKATNIFDYKSRYLLPVFLLIHLCLSVYFIQQQNIAFDEPGYADYSKRWLKGNADRINALDDSKTPLTFVAWAPRIVKQLLQPDVVVTDWGVSDLQNGRYMFLLFFYAIVFYVIIWSRNLYGNNGYWLPLLLLLTEPLMMTYGLLINSDIISGFIAIACMYHFYRLQQANNSRTHMLATGIYIGLGLATKTGFIFLPLILIVCYCIKWLNEKRILRQDIGRTIIILSTGLLILNSCFMFQGSFNSLQSYSFKSEAQTSLQQSFSWMKLPLLVPRAFIQSVDSLQYHAQLGPGYESNPFAGVYIDGVYSRGGLWYYYLKAMAIKLPPGSIVLILFAIITAASTFNQYSFVNRYQYLIVPTLIYLVVLSLFNPFQIGIRHILIFLPFVFVALGYLQRFKSSTTAKQIAIAACILVNVVSVSTFYPDIIPYNNRLFVDDADVHKYLYDSSIDYGQADAAVTDFLKNNPGYSLAPNTPSKGLYIIQARFVMDKWESRRKGYGWLRTHKPTGVYRHVWLVYDTR